jgi:hypothetical protein
MNMMLGACFTAWVKRSLTRAAPTPTNISTKSEPAMLDEGFPKKDRDTHGAPAWPILKTGGREFKRRRKIMKAKGGSVSSG